MPGLGIEALFARYHLPLYRFARRACGERALAEDLVQEVFLRVARGIDRYDERGREVAWLFRIARNLLKDRARQATRRPPVDPLLDRAPIPIAPMQELSAELDQALARLPPEDREIFLLREIGGLDYEELAVATETSVDAVRSRLFRARCALREALTTPLVRGRGTRYQEGRR